MPEETNPLRWLVGLRDDLDLSAYWWHRAFMVLLLLGPIAYVGFVAWQLQGAGSQAAVGDVEIVARLREYAAGMTDVPNAVPSFEALGSVGVLNPSGDTVAPWPASPPLASQVFCSHSLADYPAEQLAFIKRNGWTVGGVPPADLQVSQVEAWLAAAVARDGSIRPGSCLDPNDILPTDVNTVVAYRQSASAQRTAWLSQVLSVGLILVAVILVTLNLYYRGLVYVMFGGRRRVPPGAAPAKEDPGANEEQ